LRIRVHTADADATKQFRPVSVGGVYWALDMRVHGAFIMQFTYLLTSAACKFGYIQCRSTVRLQVQAHGPWIGATLQAIIIVSFKTRPENDNKNTLTLMVA